VSDGGLLVDLSAAQRPEDPAAAAVESCVAALLATPGSVRALLLDPAAPLPGTLHARLLGSGLLRWNTAAEVRRAAASGTVAYVTFGAAVPAHVERLGVSVVHVAATAAPAEVLAAATRSAVRVDVVPRLHVVAVCAPDVAANARLLDALASQCDLDVLHDDTLVATVRAPAYDGVVHILGAAAPAEVAVLRSARRVSGVLWLHDVALAQVHRVEASGDARALAAVVRRMYADRAPLPLLDALDRGAASAFDAGAVQRYGLLLSGDVVRVARAVVVPSDEAARRLRLDQGANGPCPPVSVCTPGDAGAAAAHVLSLVAQSGAVVAA